MNKPTGAGQAVTDGEGSIGITTTHVRKNGSIGVMWIGGNYDVRSHTDYLTRVTLTKEED